MTPRSCFTVGTHPSIEKGNTMRTVAAALVGVLLTALMGDED